MLLLAVLPLEEKYGADVATIVSRMQMRTERHYKLFSMFATIQRLEDEGLVASKLIKTKNTNSGVLKQLRHYWITVRGYQTLKAELVFLRKRLDVIERLIR